MAESRCVQSQPCPTISEDGDGREGKGPGVAWMHLQEGSGACSVFVARQ